jgi:hypothetical protein
MESCSSTRALSPVPVARSSFHLTEQRLERGPQVRRSEALSTRQRPRAPVRSGSPDPAMPAGLQSFPVDRRTPGQDEGSWSAGHLLIARGPLESLVLVTGMSSGGNPDQGTSDRRSEHGGGPLCVVIHKGYREGTLVAVVVCAFGEAIPPSQPSSIETHPPRSCRAPAHSLDPGLSNNKITRPRSAYARLRSRSKGVTCRPIRSCLGPTDAQATGTSLRRSLDLARRNRRPKGGSLYLRPR